ncbi:MAG: cytochrome c3 family protein [Planctomycetota bacterium]
MKINVLLIFATIVGVSAVAMIAFAGQTGKPLTDSPMSHQPQMRQANYDPNSEGPAADDSGVAWGLHEPIKSCTPCHGDQSQRISSDKPPLVAPVPALCCLCHKEYVAMGGWVHGPVATGNCLLCHERHQTSNNSLLNKPIPELCYQCHETKILRLIAGHSDESYATCNDCHEGHTSPGRMLLKQDFLNTDAGLAYVGRHPSVLPRPTFVDRSDSLAGLEGIEVIPVLNGSDLFKSYAVTEDLLKAEVESQLQLNGIGIIQHKEQTTRQTSLHIQLRLMEMPSQRGPGQVDGLSGSFNISLRQTVELLPTPGDSRRRLCTATTWDTGAIFIWGTSGVKEGLKEAVEVLVDQFSRNYLQANAKEQASLPVSGGH